MADKMMRINAELHKRIKIRATLHNTTIKDWVESALTDALKNRTLVDTRTEYITEGENDANHD